jgi:hypothetical protein
MKSLITLFSAAVSIGAAAQSVPALPGKITPGAKDTSYFVCQVASINEDETTRYMSGKRSNLWTLAAVGGKFEAISFDNVRVMAADVNAARADLYAFYQQHAAAAYIRSPIYDSKGKKSIGSVVESCEADASRATAVRLTSAPKESYVKLDSDGDYAIFALKQLKPLLADDKLALMYGSFKKSSDAFEAQELTAKHAQTIKGLMAKASTSKFVQLHGLIKIPVFSFDSGTFNLSELKRYVDSYSYSFTPGNPLVQRERMPVFSIATPVSMMAYKPNSVEEAKLIERERAAAYDGLHLVSYVQVSDAQVVNGTYGNFNVKVNGTLAQVDVLGKKGNVLFSMSVK